MTCSRFGLSSVYGFIVIFTLLMAGIGAALTIMDSQAAVWNAQDRARQTLSSQRDERLTLFLNGTSLTVGNDGLVPSQLLYLYQKNGATSSDRRIDSSLPEGANLTLPVSAGMTSFAVITSLGNVFWVTNGTQPQLDPATVAVTFDASGLDPSYGPANILTVDGSSFTYSSLPKTFEWVPGSVHSYAYVQSFSAGSGSRVGWASARGLSTAMAGRVAVGQTGSVVSSYTQQYLLNVTGGDAIRYIGSPSGDGWYDAGSVGQFTSYYTWNTVGGSRQSLYAYSLDGGSPATVARVGSGTYVSSGVVMDAPHSVELGAATQYQLSVSGGDDVGYSLVSQTNDGWYDSGSALTVSSDCVWNQITGQSRQDLLSYTLDGTTTNFARPSPGGCASPVITMEGPQALAFNSVTQYYLSVSGGTGASVLGSQTDDGWFDSGSSAEAQSGYSWNVVAGQSRSNLYSYAVDGTSARTLAQAGSGTYATPAIVMNAYHSVTFYSITQYFLAVNGGSSLVFDGSQTSDGWFNAGTAAVSVTTGYDWSVVSGQSRQNLVSWNLDGGASTPVARSGTGNYTTPSFTMDTYHTLDLVGQTQYALNAVGGDGVTFSGSQTGDGWYDSGSTGSATTNYVWGVVAGQSRLNLVSWNLDGGANQAVTRVGSGTFATASVTMNAFHTVNFNSVTQYLVAVQNSVPGSGSTGALSISYSYQGQTAFSVPGTLSTLGSCPSSPNSSPAEPPGTNYIHLAFQATASGNPGDLIAIGGYTGGNCGNEIDLGFLESVPGTNNYVDYGEINAPPGPYYFFYETTGGCGDTGWEECGTRFSSVTITSGYWSGPFSGSLSSSPNTFSVAGSTVTYSYGVGYPFPSQSSSTSWSASFPSTESYSSTTCSGASVSGSTISGTGSACTLTTTYGGSYSAALGTSPTGDGWYDTGSSQQISASSSGPFSFSSWSAPVGITLSSSTSSSTTATINNYGTVTANFDVNQ